MCHKTVPGNAAVKAIDTIEISNKTCLKCHSPEYPPKPIGYNTHLAHVGKYSARVDYFARHPKIDVTANCDSCHMNIGENCQNCHVKNIPHITPPLGYNCKGCHGELDKLFQHPTINLKIHNIFNLNGTTACRMCHNPDNMASLKLASGDILSIQEPHKLCFQCHGNYYDLWNSGQHYVNKTIPSNQELKALNGEDADISSIRNALEDKWRKDNTCTNCHNPHNPSELYQLPIIGAKKVNNVSIIDVITSNLTYVIIAIIIIVAVVIFIIKKNKLKLPDLKLLKSKLSGLKLPKLKLPKISIPISVSVENSDKGSERSYTDKVENGTSNVEELENKKELEKTGDGVAIKKIDKTVVKHENETFSHKYRKDIIFIVIIFIMLSSFYVVFGAFIPIVVVASESMSPHINRGDLVFYTDISRVGDITTNDKKSSMSFEDYGDVIIYKPYGQDGVVPYVHRAMYYIEQGDEMWPGGPKTLYAGYITKGDNMNTNSQYDQQLSISDETPIKREWVVGIARFRIPYIGYIRLLLP
jgi:signal peptidase